MILQTSKGGLSEIKYWSWKTKIKAAQTLLGLINDWVGVINIYIMSTHI